MSIYRESLIECAAVALFVLMTAVALFIALDSDFVRANTCHDSGGQWDARRDVCVQP